MQAAIDRRIGRTYAMLRLALKCARAGMPTNVVVLRQQVDTVLAALRAMTNADLNENGCRLPISVVGYMSDSPLMRFERGRLVMRGFNGVVLVDHFVQELAMDRLFEALQLTKRELDLAKDKLAAIEEILER